MAAETPVLDVLAAMTAVSIESSSLDNRELMLGRIAALASVDAPAMSYLMNVGAAVDSGITVEDVQGLLIGIAPIIGTARTRFGRREHHRGARLRDRWRSPRRSRPSSRRPRQKLDSSSGRLRPARMAPEAGSLPSPAPDSEGAARYG